MGHQRPSLSLYSLFNEPLSFRWGPELSHRPSRFSASFCPLFTGRPDLKDLSKCPSSHPHSVHPSWLPAALEQSPWFLYVIQPLPLLLSLCYCHKLRTALAPGQHLVTHSSDHSLGCTSGLLSEAVYEGKMPKPLISPTHPQLAPSPATAECRSHSPA